MRNGYFKLVTMPQGFGVQVYPPQDGGEPVQILEVMNYLEPLKIDYDVQALRKVVEAGTEATFFLDVGECPAIAENYTMEIAQDFMTAKVRFYPASSTGSRMPVAEFVKNLQFRNVTWGIDNELINAHFKGTGIYCTDLIVAKGEPPRHGKDAVIEYFFNTDLHIQPTMREDGSVDYFQLNNINHCNKGDLLARIIPADEGDFGTNIQGNKIKPRDVKHVTFKYGHNILVSEDKLNLISMVDGHVELVEGKVFVSDVYQIENCDLSTGNIDFQGSVQVNGNVANNMSIKAKGNVVINGVVEGAYVEAGGNIIIARGMNGMAKGRLKAGGDVVAKFLENCTVEAEGNITTESILHSHVAAGADISVVGKKGFITGGHVQAGNKITVKNLGAVMGASTIVEVGVNPHLKAEYTAIQKEVVEIVKTIKNAQPVIANFTEKRAKGARFTPDQLNYVKNTAALLETKKKELEEKNARMHEIQTCFDSQAHAEIIVQGVVCAGTTIVISDVSTVIQSPYKYCRFEKRDGEVKMLPI